MLQISADRGLSQCTQSPVFHPQHHSVCKCVSVHMCVCKHVEVKGQFLDIRPLLLLSGSQSVCVYVCMYVYVYIYMYIYIYICNMCITINCEESLGQNHFIHSSEKRKRKAINQNQIVLHPWWNHLGLSYGTYVKTPKIMPWS